jgi:hypothetical protein
MVFSVLILIDIDSANWYLEALSEVNYTKFSPIQDHLVRNSWLALSYAIDGVFPSVLNER